MPSRLVAAAPVFRAAALLLAAACGRVAVVAGAAAMATACGKVSTSGTSPGAAQCGLPCAACAPEVLAPGSFQRAVAQDKGALYAVRTDKSLASTVRIDKADGNVTVLSSTAMTRPPVTWSAMTVDESRVYWTREGGLCSVPLGGGAVTFLVTDLVSDGGSIARAGSRLYYPAGPIQAADNPGVDEYSVAAVPVDGGPASVVFSHRGQGGGPPQGNRIPTWVAAWQDNVVIAGGGDQDRGENFLATVTPAGESTELMNGWPGNREVNALVVDGSFAFFLSCRSGPEVVSVPLDGGTPTLFARLDQDYCYETGLAVDSRSVYLHAGDKLWSSPRAKPGFVPIADAPRGDGRQLLLVDDCYLYWIEPQGLMRLRKPE